MKPLEWMRAVRDHQPKPGPNSTRYVVLWALALRMKPDGTGFCSQRQIATDVEAGERTVRRHLAWAREAKYLRQTRRGHRIDANTVIASEYELTQPATGDLLGMDPTGQVEHPNRPDANTQPATSWPPQRSSSQRSSSIARASPSHNGDSPDEHEQWMALEVDVSTAQARECADCGRPFSSSVTVPDDRLCSTCRELP